MSAGARLTGYFEAIREALKAAPQDGAALFQDVRVHLDPFDMEAALKESFQTPAARVIFAIGHPESNLDGGYDLRLQFLIAVVCRRSGRPSPEFASADTEALGRLLDTAALVTSDPYFGQTKVSAAKIRGLKVAVSEKSSEGGLAVTLMECEARLLCLVAPWSPAVATLTTGPSGPITIGVDGAPLAGVTAP